MKLSNHLRATLLPLLGLVLASSTASYAALMVEVLDTVKIHEIRKYGYFPSIQLLATGELICDFTLDADDFELEANFWGYAACRDHGKTWGMRNTGGMIYREAAYTRDPSLPDGSMLIVAGYPLPGPGDDYRNVESIPVKMSDGGNVSQYSRDVRSHRPTNEELNKNSAQCPPCCPMACRAAQCPGHLGTGHRDSHDGRQRGRSLLS